MSSVVTSTLKNKYATKIKMRDHEILADEPIEMGGKNLGPTPSELMCAALASCISITLRMYIDRKEWNVDEIIVAVEYQSASERNAPNVFVKRLEFKGDLDSDQIDRLHLIATKCPISKALSGDIEIKSE